MESDEDIKIKIQEIVKDEHSKLGYYSAAEIMHSLHKRILEIVYYHCFGSTTLSARFLNINRTTLVPMLRRYGVKDPEKERRFVVCPKCRKTLTLTLNSPITQFPQHTCVAEKRNRRKKKSSADGMSGRAALLD